MPSERIAVSRSPRRGQPHGHAIAASRDAEQRDPGLLRGVARLTSTWASTLTVVVESPMTPEGLYPEHDLFIQLMKLKNTLRYTKGDELITHLGAEYYD